MGLPIGTNMYGAIQQIDKTTIRTQFLSVAYIPIIPVGSFYYVEGSEEEAKSIPFIYYSTQFKALEMATLDWRSVLVGYFHAACVLLFLYSVYALFTKWQVGLASLGILGLSVFLTSWLMRFVAVDTDSLFIRAICGKIFGIAFDPKYLTQKHKEAFRNHLYRVWNEEKHGDFQLNCISAYHPRKIALCLLNTRVTDDPSAVENTRLLITATRQSFQNQQANIHT